MYPSSCNVGRLGGRLGVAPREKSGSQADNSRRAIQTRAIQTIEARNATFHRVDRMIALRRLY
jgi:hypothetical protein